MKKRFFKPLKSLWFLKPYKFAESYETQPCSHNAVKVPTLCAWVAFGDGTVTDLQMFAFEQGGQTFVLKPLVEWLGTVQLEILRDNEERRDSSKSSVVVKSHASHKEV